MAKKKVSAKKKATKKKVANPAIKEYITVLKARTGRIPKLKTRANMKESQLYNNGQVAAINAIIAELEKLA